VSAHSSIKLSALSLFAASAVTLASLVLSGCATGIVAPPSIASATGAIAIEGKAYGGSTPITGAKVSIWETDPASSGYPATISAASGTQGAKIIATTTTGDGTTTINGSVPAAGAWSLAAVPNCDTNTVTGTAGPFLYVTVTGGNTGAGVNNNSVLVAALAACSQVLTNASKLHITVNESSTIAAAYALGSFLYVDNTTPGSQNVYIGSTTTNNATTGKCTGTGSSMSCVAAGLSHAFANAFNLAADANFGSQAIGQAQPTIQSNPFTGTGANANTSVPVAELNTLSNLLAYCVNSTGGTTSTTNCGKLFALATNAAGAVPTDTLTAAVNIAQNPGNNVGSATATGLYQLVNSTGPYQPNLTTYPHDWSVGIVYNTPYAPGTVTTPVTAFTNTYTSATVSTITVTASNSFVAGQTVTLSGFTGSTDTGYNSSTVQVQSSTGTTFTGISSVLLSAAGSFNSAAGDSGTATVTAAGGEPQAVALDANDNVYAPFVTSDADGVITSLTSNGNTNWTTSPSSTTCGAYNIATDTNGNVFTTNYNSSSVCPAATYGIYGFSQASGAPTYTLTNSSNQVQSSPFALAVDRANNLWYGRKSTSCQTGAGSGGNTASVCVAEFAFNSSTSAYGNATNLQTFTGSKLYNIIHLSLDAKQDVWAAGYEGGASGAWTPEGIVPNTGTVGTPTYGGNAYPATYAYEPYGMVAIDASSDAWSGGSNSGGSGPFTVFYYTYNGTAVSAASGVYNNTINTNFTPSKPFDGQFDGNNKLFFVSQSGSGQIFYYSPANQTAGYTASTVSTSLEPCYLAAGGNTCTVSTVYPDMLQIDSTGAIWVAASQSSFGTVGATSGYLVQIIGTAAPAWPQKSYAAFGVKP
jgi:hypothetical protein